LALRSPSPAEGGGGVMINCHTNSYVDGLRRRRESARRLAILDCGCSDPWGHRCHDTIVTPTDIEVDAYIQTALMLLDLCMTPAPNIPAMRVMWRRGGADRRLVQRISSLWEVSA
jgi:hypothetical protein